MSTRRRSPASFDYEGAPLINALYQEADRRGEWTNEIAAHLGLSPSYFSSIAGGLRPVSAFGRPTLERAAEYLSTPLVQVYVLAEHLGPKAFLSKETAESQLNRAFKMIREDTDWSMVAPSDEDWARLPFSAKALIVMMYQRIIGKAILSAVKVPDYKSR